MRSEKNPCPRMTKPLVSLVMAVVVVLFSTSALAMKPALKNMRVTADTSEQETTAAPAAVPAAAPPVTAPSSELEQHAERERRALGISVDRRYRLSKRWQNEFGIFGGDYLGDEWLNTWDAGAHYYLHFNNTFAVGASYFFSRIRANTESDFGQSLATKNQHAADAELMISNDCAFRAGKTIIECDLYLTLGMGMIQINRQWKPMGLVGGGMKVYLPVPWLAVRFDVNSPIHPTPKPGGNSFNADIAFNLGLSFLVPQRKPAEQERPLWK